MEREEKKMNEIILSGRLTSDVEVKQTQNGIPVCSFTLAVDRPKVKDTTDFIQCVAWRTTAEFIGKYFSKGQKMLLSGVLTSRKYETKDGDKRTAWEVVANSVEFCDGKKSHGEPGAVPHPEPAPTNFEDVQDNDLPF